MDYKILEKTKSRIFTVLRLLKKQQQKKQKMLKKLTSACTQQGSLIDNSVCTIFLKHKVKYNVQKQLEMVS